MKGVLGGGGGREETVEEQERREIQHALAPLKGEWCCISTGDREPLR